jgi:hypothetical protein
MAGIWAAELAAMCKPFMHHSWMGCVENPASSGGAGPHWLSLKETWMVPVLRHSKGIGPNDRLDTARPTEVNCRASDKHVAQVSHAEPQETRQRRSRAISHWPALGSSFRQLVAYGEKPRRPLPSRGPPAAQLHNSTSSLSSSASSFKAGRQSLSPVCLSLTSEMVFFVMCGGCHANHLSHLLSPAFSLTAHTPIHWLLPPD